MSVLTESSKIAHLKEALCNSINIDAKDASVELEDGCVLSRIIYHQEEIDKVLIYMRDMGYNVGDAMSALAGAFDGYFWDEVLDLIKIV